MNSIKQIINQILDFFKSCLFPKNQIKHLEQIVKPLCPTLTCIDIGASYFPHVNWELFKKMTSVNWVAVDPNVSNLGYASNWKYEASLIPVGDALSDSDGLKTLYITNTDSGSSLFKPIESRTRSYRSNHDYFYPIKETSIYTKSLKRVLDEFTLKPPFFIKLDTQGSELSILKGIGEDNLNNNVIGIELEITLKAKPLYEGIPRFYDIHPFLENCGFELLSLNPLEIDLPRTNNTVSKKIRYPLNECDAIFFMREDLIKKRDLNFKLAALIGYINYYFFGEALDLAKIISKENLDANQRKTIDEIIDFLTLK